MGRKDSANKVFFSDPERFADLVNGICFGGEQILRAEDLTDVDPHPGRRTRDVIKMTSFGVGFAIIGEESQETVDYELPVRILESDLADYRRQVRAIQKDIRQKIRDKDLEIQTLSRGERLYRYPKDAKILPVVTIVLSAAQVWDGPRDLTDMLDTEHVPEALIPYISGYRINIVELPKLTEDVTSRFRTDVRQVRDVLRCAWDGEALIRLLRGNTDYQDLDEDAYKVINEYAALRKYGFAETNEGGKCDMKNGFDWIVEHYQEIGEEIGKEQEAEKNRKNLMEIVANFLRSGDSPEKISECTKVPLEEVRKIESQLLQQV